MYRTQATGAELGAPAPAVGTNGTLLRDHLLNVLLPRHVVIAAHLFKLCWADVVYDTLGFRNINDLRNGLLLNK